jgi:hypothetical protein
MSLTKTGYKVAGMITKPWYAVHIHLSNHLITPTSRIKSKNINFNTKKQEASKQDQFSAQIEVKLIASM